MRRAPDAPIRVHDLAQGICWFDEVDGQGEQGERDCRPSPFRDLIRVRITEWEPERGRLTYQFIGAGSRSLKQIDQPPLIGPEATDPRKLTEESA